MFFLVENWHEDVLAALSLLINHFGCLLETLHEANMCVSRSFTEVVCVYVNQVSDCHTRQP